MRDDENKKALFAFLASRVCHADIRAEGKQVISTLEANYTCSDDSYESALLQSCSQEEADTRMLLHTADMVKAGHHRIMLHTDDTDVVVLAIAFFRQLGCLELWVAFGTGQHLRYIPVHDMHCILDANNAEAISFFHAFTGCDTICGFVGRGKKTCWEAWQKYPEVTAAFHQLSDMPSDISDNCNA